METATYTPGYDAAGDLVADPGSGNQYACDAEGRVCAVSGPSGTVGYIYDAEGNRVARGDIHLVNSQLSCDITQNGFLNTANGVTTPNDETDYILGPGGEQVTEMAQQADGSMQWQRTYAYAGSALIATSDPVSNPAYNPSNPSAAPRTLDMPSFRLTDWLGTLRATTDSSGALQGSCSSLPFGDGLACNGNIPDPHRFTGKERDTESGNDYFGARYYASNMGRFLSPDPLGNYVADHSNPQTWNLYSYVLNNPLINVDPTGYDCAYVNEDGTSVAPNGIDTNGSSTECSENGGYGAGETYTSSTVDSAQQQNNEIAGQINHETMGMKNSKAANVSLETAEDEVAHVRLNGIKKWGSNEKAQKYASLVSAIEKGPGFKLSQQAVEQAIMEDSKGIDPTHGAIFYNMRTVGQFKHGGPFQGMRVHTYAGPFISPSKYKYIMTYGQ